MGPYTKQSEFVFNIGHNATGRSRHPRTFMSEDDIIVNEPEWQWKRFLI